MDRYFIDSEMNGAPTVAALLVALPGRPDLDIFVWRKVSKRKVADNLHSISISRLIQDYY